MNVDEQMNSADAKVRWLYREFEIAELDHAHGGALARRLALRRMTEIHGRLMSLRRDMERIAPGEITREAR